MRRRVVSVLTILFLAMTTVGLGRVPLGALAKSQATPGADGTPAATPTAPTDGVTFRSLVDEPDLVRGGEFAAAVQDEPKPAGIYTGSCDDLGSEPAFELRDVELRDEPGDPATPVETSFGSVDAALEDLVADDHAIAVGDVDALLACGEIGDRAGDDDIFVGLRAQNRSGYGGVAWLSVDGTETRVSLFLAQGLAGEGAGTGDEDNDGPPAPPNDDETPEPDPDETPVGLGSGGYTSEIYGWELTFDESVWLVVDGPVVEPENGFEAFALSNGVSSVWFRALPATVDALQCVEITQDGWRNGEATVSVEPTLDENGDPIQGGDELDAFGVVDVTFTTDAGVDLTHTLYDRCIVLIPGSAMLVVGQEVDQKAYNAQEGAREALLEGLTLP